ncbi:MAG: helix-turn-helix domain-containing protein [Thermoflexales bacterium]|nr:helix-turn-helix domain-containing protein [Thermoflexales bacterium]
MNHASSPATTGHQLLTLAQVAHRMNVSRRTVFRWIESGALPAVRLGAVIRIEPADLDRLIQNHQVQASAAPRTGTASGVTA